MVATSSLTIPLSWSSSAMKDRASDNDDEPTMEQTTRPMNGREEGEDGVVVVWK